ncbi:hypothetical protein [Streptomyces canus]|uniref:hypothetical protein n=1 Tax=Streptomyces canus TaxID=58343 RepID=UPI0036F11AA9
MTSAPATPRDAHRSRPQAPGHADHKADPLALLNKIEGQMGGISRMVTGDRYRTSFAVLRPSGLC